MKRRSKYRKHVEASILDELPEPSNDEELVIVVAHRGGNLVEVKPLKRESTENEGNLCLLPSKFRKLVWVKRGTIIIVKKAQDDYQTTNKKVGKVVYSAVNILFENQVKNLIKKGFLEQSDIDRIMGHSTQNKEVQGNNVVKGLDLVSPVDMQGVFINRNRRKYDESDSDSESDSE